LRFLKFSFIHTSSTGIIEDFENQKKLQIFKVLSLIPYILGTLSS